MKKFKKAFWKLFLAACVLAVIPLAGCAASDEAPEEVLIEDSSTYTRGEWLTLFAEKLGISPIELTGSYNCFYGDSEESEYGALAETFHALKLLPAPDSEGYEDPEQDIPLFEADKPATREFVAYMVAKAMGFEGEHSLDCNDENDIDYMSEVAVVVGQAFLVLDDDGNFNPDESLIGTDKNRIFNKIDDFDESTEITEDQFKDEVTFVSDVKQINESGYTVEQIDDEHYTVTIAKNDTTSAITQGTVFTLPSGEGYVGGLALKAESVSERSGKLVIDCTVPDMEEVVKDFDFAGYGEAALDDITVADGVYVEYNPNGAIVSGDDSALAPFDESASFTMPGTLTFTTPEKEIGNTGITFSGEVVIAVPNVTAIAKGKVFGGFSLQELTVKTTTELKYQANVEYDFGIPESSYDLMTGDPTFGSGKTELGRVPIKLGAVGLSLDFVLFANLDVSGQVSITYTIESTNGFQYKNGAFRLIKDYTRNFDGVSINGSAKVGAGLALRLSLFSVFDLVGVDVHAGLGVDIGFEAHYDVDPTLYCGDGTVYLYATLEFDEDTLIIAILNDTTGLSWSWDIFDKDNSPLKAGIHIENAHLVDECTYSNEKGHILGSVKDAESDEPIRGAKIEIYNAVTEQLIDTVKTQSVSLVLSDLELYEGEFLAENLPVGHYRLDVLATGYKKYSINIEVLAGQRVVCEAALMLLREDIEGDGYVTGRITDALTGAELTGTNYYIRAGWSTIDGDIIASGYLSGTSYSVVLAPGNYTIEIAKDGYISAYGNITIRSGVETVKSIAITPLDGIEIDSDSIRVVLTWGEYPRDLDSHLYMNSTTGSEIFHIWYRNKNYYGDVEADLDVDDTSSYGPETTTVYSMDQGGIYSFYVHDFTNRSEEYSTDMSNSGAQVLLYSGGDLIRTFNIPQNREGTLWHVFDYNPTTGRVTYVNQFTYSEAG